MKKFMRRTGMMVAIALSMTMVLGTHALASEPENLDDSIRAEINEYVSEQYSSLSSVHFFHGSNFVIVCFQII